jgi:hypothetical protein
MTHGAPAFAARLAGSIALGSGRPRARPSARAEAFARRSWSVAQRLTAAA